MVVVNQYVFHFDEYNSIDIRDKSISMKNHISQMLSLYKRFRHKNSKSNNMKTLHHMVQLHFPEMLF